MSTPTMTYHQILEQLEPYMEILDPAFLQTQQSKFEALAKPGGLEQASLGIIYHELCVVHYLRGKDKQYAPYAQKSLDTLRMSRPKVPVEALPIVDTYITSARSLVAAVTSNLLELIKVIREYDRLVARDGALSYCPAFLQASLLENLPNLFGAHRKAKHRFDGIIAKRQIQPNYASDKIVGFCYLSLAKFEENPERKQTLLRQSLQFDTDGSVAAAMGETLLAQTKTTT